MVGLKGARRLRSRMILDLVTTLAMLVAASVIVWAALKEREPQSISPPRPPRPGRVKPIPKEPIPLAGAPLLGNSAAKVAVIEFSDYECPFCAKYHQKTFSAIRKSHIDTGKVLFAFRHMPIEGRHPLAFQAAQAAECSARQAKFWEFNDLLFTEPKGLDEQSLRSKAGKIGLDTAQFQACLAGGVRQRVEEDVALAKAAGISSTPSFLIGIVRPDRTLQVVRHESGAVPAPAFARMLDDTLKGLQPTSK